MRSTTTHMNDDGREFTSVRVKCDYCPRWAAQATEYARVVFTDFERLPFSDTDICKTCWMEQHGFL